MSILLIISLTGVFCHQLIRMFMLIKAPKRARPRRRVAHGRRHGTPHRTKRHDGAADDMPPEKPIQIHMSSDDGFDPDVEIAGDSDSMPAAIAVQHPPPVYGNFRTSTVSFKFFAYRSLDTTRSPFNPLVFCSLSPSSSS